ncbi:flavonol 4'-sulfotransferase [Quercus suber]|uniref:Sulfotransferase n=1 Tax=Quercus suber TaxID=58331 RepID=A0AAW0K8E6_QUESU
MGYPFSFGEDDKGVVKNIINLCSFENMKSLEVNKSGITQFRANELATKNDAFFRKGKVGDWNNCLTLEMAMQLDQITK